MRKANRQVTALDEIRNIIERCEVCRIALNSPDGYPYIVPLNFGYALDESGRLTLYFHGANEGRKLELLLRDNAVGFEMDGAHQLITGANACDYTYEYESVIGTGRLVRLESEPDKMEGLAALMRHYGWAQGLDIPPQMLKMTAVLRLDAGDYTAKRLSK